MLARARAVCGTAAAVGAARRERGQLQGSLRTRFSSRFLVDSWSSSGSSGSSSSSSSSSSNTSEL